jgi:AAA family ATP:ADP antiporter
MTHAPLDAIESPPAGAVRPSFVDRALGVVTKVRPGEGGTALLLAAALFLLLLAYYIIKPVREALILQHPAGAEYKSYLGAAIAVLLLFVVPAYAALSDRLPRNRLVVSVTLFFSLHLVLFYAASQLSGLSDSLLLSLVFFVWVGIFNMMLVAQLWAFANDVYDKERGERLFVVIGLGASIGAIAGNSVDALLSGWFDVFEMLLVAAVALVGVALICEGVHRRELGGSSRPADAPAVAPTVPPVAIARKGAFRLVLRERYLSLIAAFSLIFTFVNTNGEYMLGKLIKESAVAEAAGGGSEVLRRLISEEYTRFFLFVNVISLVLQFFVVSRVVQRAGVARAFFILPLIALVDGIAVTAVPVLAVLFIGKVAENSTDYSLNNTLRQMLWLPTTREMKYKAKQAVDTFFVRMGDVASGGWVFIAASVLGLGVRAFAITNTLLVVVWLWLAWAIVRAQPALSERTGGA